GDALLCLIVRNRTIDVGGDVTSEAVLDDGLLLEIVMAIKAKMEPAEVAPLPGELRSRLIGLGASLSSPPEENIDPLAAVLPDTGSSSPPVAESVEPIRIRSADTEIKRVRDSRGSTWKPIALVSIAVAVCLLAALSLQMLLNPNDTTPVAGEGIDDDRSPAPAVATDAAPEGESGTKSTLLVEDDSNRMIPEPEVPPKTLRDPIEPDPGIQPSPQPMVVESSPAPTPGSPRPVNRFTTTPIVATWSQIDGLFLRSDLQLGTDAGSQSNRSVPKSVRESSELTLVSESADSRLRLETLPLCRAEGQLTQGGKLVVADDTRLEVTRGGAMDLRYGAIALLDLGQETTIRLGSILRSGIPIRSPMGGSVVIRRTATAIEFDVTDQPIRIGEQTFANKTVRVDLSTRTVQALDDAPERLPKWTRERVHRIELGRNVLGQLATSDNVGLSIRQSLASGTARGEASMLLRQWLVASRRDQLMRMISSDDPLIRETALLYLRETRPNDPRHAELWRTVRTNSQNLRYPNLIRSLLTDYWNGQRPTGNRRDALVMMLAANDANVRATGDFLLRSFYGKGPPFIMNANARTQQRIIGNWRVVINRLDGA
ncbi:MAG: hypothetical protein AAFU85_33485, partial [Planctomycetota bacterium]